MSNQQLPGPGRQGQGNPWAQHDPNWRPQQFQDHAGRDPRQPFGTQPAAPPPTNVEPPRRPVWPWIAGIVGAIAVLLVVLLLQPGAADPNPSEQPPATAFPSPSVTGNAIPYEGNGNGVFRIEAHRWTARGLEIDYSISSEEGGSRFAFFAFLNETRESFVPVDDPTIEVGASSPTEGTVVFAMPRGDTSVVLTTATGRAITALPVPG